MVLKRFDSPEPEPTPEPTPAPERKSPFSPFLAQEDERKSVLGNKVYSATSPLDTGNAKADLQKLLEQAETGFTILQELCRLYTRAVNNPTASNVRDYSNRIKEIAKGDEELGIVLNIAVMTIVSAARGRN